MNLNRKARVSGLTAALTPAFHATGQATGAGTASGMSVWNWLAAQPTGTLVQAGVGILLFAIGGVVGYIFSLNGFTESANLSSLQASLRIRNLQYILGALVITITADFHKFGLPDGAANSIPPAAFFSGALIVFIATNIRTGQSVRRSIRDWNTRHPGHTLDEDAFLRLFRRLGEPAFEKKFQEEQAAAQTQQAEAAALRAATDFGITRQEGASTAITIGVYATVHYLVHRPAPGRAAQQAIISDILKCATTAVRAFAPHPNAITLNASLMAFWEFTDQPDYCTALANQARFRFAHPITGAPADTQLRYRGFLELCSGARFDEGVRVVLPVERPDAPKGIILPGAPAAVWSPNGIDVANVRPLDKQKFKQIPAAILTDMQSFFDAAPYRSLASIKIHSTKTHGVLNIESSEPGLLGDSDAAAYAIAALQPIAALLSSTLIKGV